MLFLQTASIYGKLVRNYSLMNLKMLLLFRDSILLLMPETTNMWGGAGPTALPTSFFIEEAIVYGN